MSQAIAHDSNTVEDLDLGVLFSTFLERFSDLDSPVRFPYQAKALSSMRGGYMPRGNIDTYDNDNVAVVEDPQDLGRDICKGM